MGMTGVEQIELRRYGSPADTSAPMALTQRDSARASSASSKRSSPRNTNTALITQAITATL